MISRLLFESRWNVLWLYYMGILSADDLSACGIAPLLFTGNRKVVFFS